MDRIPIVDVSPLVSRGPGAHAVAETIGNACRDAGFFYLTGHGVDPELPRRLERLSREFFAWDLARKQAIRMELGGRAWRGYFPVGSELTQGRPDQKEGLYFGAELGEDDPAVRAGLPMHGRNLFPDLHGFRGAVLEFMGAMTALGHTLMEGLAMGLQLDANYFETHGTRDPFTLFRIFHYPPLSSGKTDEDWSVGEHTDYGLITILHQDDTGGLEVRSRSGWLAAPPIPGAFLCNIGDMLDRMTRGLYRSTPHRVRNESAVGRLSFPFFFDPAFDAKVQAIDLDHTLVDDAQERWDGASVHEFEGTYGDYLLGKVAQVFPHLGREVR
jgi:isopenicillin N synthase-like dioxygenase